MQNKLFSNLIKLGVCVILPIIICVGLMFVASWAILSTSIPENLYSIFMIVISAIGSILMSVLFVLCYKMKGIIGSVISFVVIVIMKLIVTYITPGQIKMTGQGIIGLVFLAVFCLVGGIVGSNIKK